MNYIENIKFLNKFINSERDEVVFNKHEFPVLRIDLIQNKKYLVNKSNYFCFLAEYENVKGVICDEENVIDLSIDAFKNESLCTTIRKLQKNSILNSNHYEFCCSRSYIESFQESMFLKQLNYKFNLKEHHFEIYTFLENFVTKENFMFFFESLIEDSDYFLDNFESEVSILYSHAVENVTVDKLVCFIWTLMADPNLSNCDKSYDWKFNKLKTSLLNFDFKNWMSC